MPNKRAADMVVTSLALPRELLAAARSRAADEDSSVSAVIREALEHHVKAGQ